MEQHLQVMATEDRFVNSTGADEYRCPICTEISLNLVETNPCGHLFCEECLAVHLQKRHNCPTCRHTLGQPHYNVCRYLRRQLGNMRVHCVKRPREEDKGGCNEVYALKDEPEHKRVCLYIEDTCECNRVLPRIHLQRHRLEECPRRTMRCRNRCGWENEAQYEEEHHLNCRLRPMRCAHCDLEMLKHQVAAHESGCPRRKLACPLCDAQVPQGEMEAHVAASAGHLSRAVKELMSMRSFLEERKLLKEYLNPPFSLCYEHYSKRGTVLVWPTDTIEEVRARLPAALQPGSLIWSGKSLNDCLTLESYNLVSCNLSRPVQVIGISTLRGDRDRDRDRDVR